MSELMDRSDPHRRTRRDHSTETAEDYVEAMAEIMERNGTCRVVDLAKHFGVSHVTVTRIVTRLQHEGLLIMEKYRPIEPTTKGCRLPKRSCQRHKIVIAETSNRQRTRPTPRHVGLRNKRCRSRRPSRCSS